MAHIALFRKYRSQDFAQLSGQDHIGRTLRNALRLGRIAQAYLFCGPRGTGKTSSARIFAKALNCVGPDPAQPLADPPQEPCNQCPLCKRITEGSCLDVTEIDAASHTGVDNIREAIITKADFAPVEGRRKVYIIDEVHKLSQGAFNALLKTLEEPPAHLVFVLATTEPDEVPQTILSRCQRFEFRRIGKSDILARLQWVAEQEGFTTEPEALELLAQAADGAMRDALVLFEQAAAFGEGCIDQVTVTSMLGLTGRDVLIRFVEVLLSRNIEQVMAMFDQLLADGKDPVQLGEDLLRHLRALLLVRVAGPRAAGLLKVHDDVVASLAEQANLLEATGWMRLIKEFMELLASLRDPSQARLQWEVALIRQMSQGLEGRGASMPGTAPGYATGGSAGAPTPLLPPPARLPTPPPASFPPSQAVAAPSLAGAMVPPPPSPPPAASAGAPAGTSSSLAERTPAFASPSSPAGGADERPPFPPPSSSVPHPPSSFPGAVQAQAGQAPMPPPPVVAPPLVSSPGGGGVGAASSGTPSGSEGPPTVNLASFRQAWERMLAELGRERRMPLLGVLREAHPARVEGSVCVVAVAPHLTFHQDKIDKEKGELASRLSALLGTAVRLAVDGSGSAAPPSPSEAGTRREAGTQGGAAPRVGAAQHDAFVQEGRSIFGGEVIS